MYAEANQGQLPPEKGARGLSYVWPRYVTLPKVFHCVKDRFGRVPELGKPLDEDHCSYVYFPGASPNVTNDAPICWDKPANHGPTGMNVLFNDGHVEWVTLERWEKIRPKD